MVWFFLAVLIAAPVEAAAVDERTVRVRVNEFGFEHGELRPYVAEAGDEVRVDAESHGVVRSRTLVRGGVEVGHVVGPEGDLHVSTFHKRVGEPVDRAALEDPAAWAVGGLDVVGVRVKRQPRGASREGPGVRHDVYLTLEPAMTWGRAYDMTLPGGEAARVEFGPMAVSPAVHVTQVGFRPDDPVKLARLSHWTGEPVSYAPGPFAVRDAATGAAVLEGRTMMRLAADEVSGGFKADGRNFAGTDVLVADFSTFDEPGRYVLSVDGVGCSMPFEIGRGVYGEAFAVAMTGILHQRSGIAWETPDFSWDQPRAMHPDDGHVTYDLGVSRLDLIAEHGGHEAVMDSFASEHTGEVVADAWGGYRDAGDHDRHTGHLVVAHRLLELYELFPEHFDTLELAMPERGGELPDLLDEALWVVDFFVRTQRDDGGVIGGIETDGHPNANEPSYLDTLTAVAFAPDVMSSWRHAAAAAHAASVLKLAGHDDRAATYAESARRAWDWAERTYAEDRDRLEAMGVWWQVRGDRALAAAHLYRLTGEDAYHDTFRASIGFDGAELPFVWESHDDVDAAFVYARLPDELADARLRDKARAVLLTYAQQRAEYAASQAFGWTAKDDGAPLFGGFASVPRGRVFALAHALTGDDRWLGELVASSLAAAGDNPLNQTFTVGLGHDWPRWPLQVDRTARGEPQPWRGYTVYGLHDQAFQPLPEWMLTWVANDQTTNPPPMEWPVMESFFDVESYLMMNENTVWQTQGPSAYVWGYLDARE